MVLETDYVGNRGSFLNSTNAINNPQPGSGGIQARRPYPRFGGINMFAQDVSTTYHSLQAKLEKRLSAGLWYMVSYSWLSGVNYFSLRRQLEFPVNDN
jgi:hypothetical protein